MGRRQRLIAEQQRRIEQLRNRFDLDDAGLFEQVAHDRVVHLTCAGLENRGYRVPARLHRHDRLAPCDAACDARELARVAETLEVEEHDLGRGVGVPVLQQVVSRQIGAVAGGHERGQTHAGLRSFVENRDAQRTRLAEEPDVAAAGRMGASVALSLNAGSLLATPRALGPISRIPCARAACARRRSASRPSVLSHRIRTTRPEAL